jgi:hypothetical protein
MTSIIAMGIATVCCGIGAVIAIQYYQWRSAMNYPDHKTKKVLSITIRYCIHRFYAVGASIRTVLRRYSSWCTSNAQTWFFVFFPKAQQAFVEKNALTGLSDGPLSYYLMAISEEKKQS